jgi:hypothetical protein|nr:hypothetical protein [Paraburkholderia sp. BL8N3]
MSEKVGKIRFYPMPAARLEFTRSARPARIFFRIRAKQTVRAVPGASHAAP